mgnify:CR=1 FL=1
MKKIFNAKSRARVGCVFCMLGILGAIFAFAFAFGFGFDLPIFSSTERIEANADTGPKPSVHVTFANMGDELCYGTLLSKTPSTGPARAWDGTEEGKYLLDDGNESVWRALVDYKDSDGYYFLQWFRRVDESKTLDWTYFPPQEFKILLYYPERATNDTASTAGAAGVAKAFASSGALERYAFHSYFFINMADTAGETNGELIAAIPLNATENYDYSAEIFGFFVRFFVTLGVETLLALAFGLRTKRAFFTVLTANGVTQILLNIVLNVRLHFNNIYGIFPLYFLAEICIFLAEAALYCVVLGKRKNGENNSFDGEKNGKTVAIYSKKRLIFYALTANLVSFLIGLPLAYLLPAAF